MNTDQHDLKGALPFTLSFDDAPVGMSFTTLDGHFLRVNRRLCEITGYTADELLRMDFQAITHPDDVMTDVHKHQQALAGLINTYRLDKRYIRKNGSSVWVNITITLVRDERGEPSYSFGVVEDGLQREQSQVQRQDVTIGLRKVLAATNQLMACPTTDSMLKVAVEFARNTLGLERCAIFFQREGYIQGTYGTDGEGNTTDEHEIRVDLNDQWPQQVAQLQADGAQWLMVDNRKHTEWDGEHVKIVGMGWVVITLIPIANGPKCYMFNDTHLSNAHIDETQQEIVAVYCSLLGRMIERRQVEEALNESETRLQQAIHAANIGIFEHDHITDKIFWSRVQRNIFGWTSEESKGLNEVLQTVYPDDHARIKHAVQKAHDPHGDGIYDVEYRIVADDGSIRWLSVHSLTMFEGEGDQRHPLRTVGATADITDRRKVEEALRESEQMLRNILDSIPVRVFWKDMNLRLLGCNQHFADDMGVTSPAELIGKTTEDLIHEQSPQWDAQSPQFASDDRRVLDSGQALLDYEEQQMRGDHNLYWVRTSKLPIRNADGKVTGLLCTYEDITDRKITELALQKKREEEHEFQVYLKALHQINIELTMIDNLDDFYRQIVELGLTQLGFDRVSLWLYDAEHGTANGTYGTDDHGQLISESHMSFELEPSSAFWQSLQKPDRFMYTEQSELFHNFEVVGSGWLVSVALWQGHRNLGWLSIDNLINHRPISQPQLEILAQYGMQVGTLLARKRVKEALLESEIFLKKSQSVGKLGSYYFNVDTGDWISSPRPCIQRSCPSRCRRIRNSWSKCWFAASASRLSARRSSSRCDGCARSSKLVSVFG